MDVDLTELRQLLKERGIEKTEIELAGFYFQAETTIGREAFAKMVNAFEKNRPKFISDKFKKGVFGEIVKEYGELDTQDTKAAEESNKILIALCDHIIAKRNRK